MPSILEVLEVIVYITSVCDVNLDIAEFKQGF